MNDPRAFAVWPDHPYKGVPSTVQVRRGKNATGKEVIVFYKPTDGTWAAVMSDAMSQGKLEYFLNRIAEKPVVEVAAEPQSAV